MKRNWKEETCKLTDGEEKALRKQSRSRLWLLARAGVSQAWVDRRSISVCRGF